MSATIRPESDVFDDLKALCTTAGYIHVLAFICFRDNAIFYGEELTSSDFEHIWSPDRLIRTELSTLLGLMIMEERDLTMPAAEIFQSLVSRTDNLLQELHQSLNVPMTTALEEFRRDNSLADLLATGPLFREPIFYSGESAYSFQYRDLAPKKYCYDEPWLTKNLGFTIGQATVVAKAIAKIQLERLPALRRDFATKHPDEWTLLSGYTFELEEAAAHAGESLETVRRIVQAFSVPAKKVNANFCALGDFNVIYATPILEIGPNSYALFQMYSLYEALYDNPFYWMLEDKSYLDTAFANRGRFTEEFATECMVRVFGGQYVHSNVLITESPGSDAAEIDVLVLFGDLAIVLQAKSKRLTLAARKGNDGAIKEDFQKSIQDSYDQGRKCAEFLLGRKHFALDNRGNRLNVPALKKIYLISLVSDHYPALSFQTGQLLKSTISSKMPSPFIMDVFTLDVMTEMLASPLYFLSYIDRRTEYGDRITAGHELTILSLHLKSNLWMDGTYDRMMLTDDICADLDVAMTTRRELLPGKRTPDGILTRVEGTPFAGLIKQIERKPRPELIELGFALLKMSSESISQLSHGIDQVTQSTRADLLPHDFSMGCGDTGFTVHCNLLSPDKAKIHLMAHVQMRKYRGKSASWFGLNVSWKDSRLQFGYTAVFPWRENPTLEEASMGLRGSPPMKFTGGKLVRQKVGRNEPCPCKSGKKYKKCHGAS